MDVKSLKQTIRERIWRLLEEKDVAVFPRPVYGRIPNFKGAEQACERLLELPEFKEANVVKVNPDSPQRRCRELVLEYGKILIMPTPRIREGFLLLDPSKLPRQYIKQAATIKGAFEWGRPIKPWEAPKIDLVIIGSVAVNPNTGRRLGKSHGYAELEWGIMRSVGKVDETTPVITTVHELQLVNDDIPKEPFDLPVDIILTPMRVIRVRRIDEKPRGIYWEYITDDVLREIPILKELKDFLKAMRF